MQDIENKNILLIISGGIAAYKCLELIRLIRRGGGHITPVLTKGGAQFVTELSVTSLCEEQVYTDLWSLKDETEMGHIRLSREADLVLVAPASANMIARMAQGMANDLASTVLLATDKPVMIAPAMNPMMWSHPATQRNIATLRQDGITLIGPNAGDMACGETGTGRMAEPQEIFDALRRALGGTPVPKPLAGKTALVTSGPTYEPIDPVRFLGNHSSGKQGHAIAKSLKALGADVTLITGPVSLPDPADINTVHVNTASDMLAACQTALPVDIAVCAAAVSDWAPVDTQTNKIKKQSGKNPPVIKLKETPDCLAALGAAGPNRPALVIGFAAETENMIEYAQRKRDKKNCDWIAANNVSAEHGVFGGDNNHVHLITEAGKEAEWSGSKTHIANKICERITHYFLTRTKDRPNNVEQLRKKQRS